MPPFGQISKAIAYLRSENPPEDVSKNPIVKHPHNTTRTIPERLSAATIKELSALEPAKAVASTAEEWAAIIAAIALCSFFWHPVLYLIAVVVIGSRQHALLILGHDASHYRYLPTRWQNDLVANIFLMWPTFASVEGFRKFHGTHHQYTNLPNDGNRHIWYTHDAMGELERGWRFPKTRVGLALVLLHRAFFVTGMFWIVRGLVGASLIPSPHWMIASKIAFYSSIAGALTFFEAWPGFLLFWLVPFCTWHIAVQYVRIICEHSAVESDEAEYAITRTTIPTFIESLLILPRNVGYHLEHHWYPSVPFYRLPDLHEHLMAREGFRMNAVVRRSVITSLGECVRA
ncbi:MAG: fatty acid desaturase family protein [Methyloceanibacter sp.]